MNSHLLFLELAVDAGGKVEQVRVCFRLIQRNQEASHVVSSLPAAENGLEQINDVIIQEWQMR